MAVASMFSVLIFKTIPRVRTRSIVGVLRPWTAAMDTHDNATLLLLLNYVK